MESAPSRWENSRRGLLVVVAACWVFFQLAILLHPQPPMVERPAHLCLALAVFLLGHAPARGGRQRSPSANWCDALLLAGVAAVLVYYALSWQRLQQRMEGVDPVLPIDLAAGTVLVLIVLECVRRAVGWTLLSVILAFLALGFAGTLVPGWTRLEWIPELLRFSGFSAGDAAENFSMTDNGLLGITTATSLTFVFYFVMFGAVYSAIGGGRLFIDIGLRLAGRRAGGAAKAAVISSGLVGSISGSAVANVATTGLFTIPLMRRAGYTPAMAGAVEAIASTGGQLMPPVMGVAAFVMADLLQVSYGRIALAALIPALAFYWAVFLGLGLHARRRGMAIPENGEATNNRTASIGRRLHLLTPIAVLVGLLFYGLAANLCAVFAAGACVAIGLFERSASWRDWAGALTNGVRQAAAVAVPIAAIGIIIEVAIQSGLVLEFSAGLLDLAGGSLVAALLWIVLGCVIMGMGLPTVAAYIIGAVLFVPALREFGFPEIPSHFFVMYYCVLSMVTPPVALASYTAAGLANAPVMDTCLRALRMGMVAFAVPFVFLFSPELLGFGRPVSIAVATLTLLAGVTVWTVAVEGHLMGRNLSGAQRAWFGLTGAGFLILPLCAPDLLGNTTRWIPLAAGGPAIASGVLWCLRNPLVSDESSS